MTATMTAPRRDRHVHGPDPTPRASGARPGARVAVLARAAGGGLLSPLAAGAAASAGRRSTRASADAVGGSRALAELLRDQGVQVAPGHDEPPRMARRRGPATRLLVAVPDLLADQPARGGRARHRRRPGAASRRPAPSRCVAGGDARRGRRPTVRARRLRAAGGRGGPATADAGWSAYDVDRPGGGAARRLLRPRRPAVAGAASRPRRAAWSRCSAAAGAFTNDRLDDEGNAALALGLLGAHAAGWSGTCRRRATCRPATQKSLYDLRARGVWWALVQVGLAVLLLALWRARRLGPVVAEPLPVVVRAAETVEGRARLYRRGRRPRTGPPRRCGPAPASPARSALSGCPGAPTPAAVVDAVAAPHRREPRRRRARCCTVPHRPTTPRWCGSPTTWTPSRGRYADRDRPDHRARRGSRRRPVPTPAPTPRARPLRALRAEVGQGRRRPGRRRHRAGHRAAVPRPRAARGRARRGQDAAGAHARRGAVAGHQAGAVHPRPDARRRHRLAGLRRAHGASSRSAPGPVFTNLLLADEINRTPPKTQAALLEAMEERQVSVDGRAAAAARPVRRRRHPEPGRVRGHLPAARGPARPVPAQADACRCRRATRRSQVLRPARRGLRPARPGRRRRPAGRRRRATSRPGGPPCAACTVAPEVLGYVVDLCPATRDSPSLSARRLAARRHRAAGRGQGLGLAVRPRLRDPGRRQGARPAGAAAPGRAAARGRAGGRHRRRGARRRARRRSPSPADRWRCTGRRRRCSPLRGRRCVVGAARCRRWLGAAAGRPARCSSPGRARPGAWPGRSRAAAAGAATGDTRGAARRAGAGARYRRRTRSARRVRGRLRDAWPPSAGRCPRSGTGSTCRPASGGGSTTALLPDPARRPAGRRVTVRSVGPLGPGRPAGLARRAVAGAGAAAVHVAQAPARRSWPGCASSTAAPRCMVRGQGTEFDSLREYVDGDDVRSIDWRATARRRRRGGAHLAARARPAVAARARHRPHRGRPGRRRAAARRRDGRRAAARRARRPGRRPGRPARLRPRGAGRGSRASPAASLLPALVAGDGAAGAGAGRDRLRAAWSPTVLRRGRPRASLVVLLTALDAAPVEEGLLPVLGPLTAPAPGGARVGRRPAGRRVAAGRGDTDAVYDAAAAERARGERARVDRAARAGAGVEVVDAARGRCRPRSPTATWRSRPPAGSEPAGQPLLAAPTSVSRRWGHVGAAGAAHVAGLAGSHRPAAQHHDVRQERQPHARRRCRPAPRSAAGRRHERLDARRRRAASRPARAPARPAARPSSRERLRAGPAARVDPRPAEPQPGAGGDEDAVSSSRPCGRISPKNRPSRSCAAIRPPATPTLSAFCHSSQTTGSRKTPSARASAATQALLVAHLRRERAAPAPRSSSPRSRARPAGGSRRAPRSLPARPGCRPPRRRRPGRPRQKTQPPPRPTTAMPGTAPPGRPP